MFTEARGEHEAAKQAEQFSRDSNTRHMPMASVVAPPTEENPLLEPPQHRHRYPDDEAFKLMCIALIAGFLLGMTITIIFKR